MKLLSFSLTAFLSAAAAAQQPAVAEPRTTQAPQAVKPAPALDVERRADAYYYFAMGRLNEGYYETTGRSEYAARAIEFYRKAYELDPRASVIGERLAEMYAKTQRIRDAVLEAQEVLRRDPDNLPARRLLARIYLRTLGNLSGADRQRELVARAVEQHREILRLDPEDTETALWLARLYRLQDEHDKAGEVLSAVLAREPENEYALEQYTQLLLDQGRPQQAIERLERIAERSPTPRLLGLLGDAYAQMREYAPAERALRQAVVLDGRDPDLHRGLAQVLLSQGKAQDALEQYQRLADLEPNNPDNHLRLAQVYRHLRNLEKAEEHLLRAKQQAPGNLEVIYHEALLYEAQGRFEEAIRVLSDAAGTLRMQTQRSAEGRRTLAVLYEQLGRLYREVENYTAAVNTLAEMAAVAGDDSKRARLLLIDTYRAAKEIDRALEESRRALQLFPNDRELVANQALLLGEKGATDEGAAMLRGTLRGSREDRIVYVSLAQLYERARRYEEAEQAARRAEQLAAHPADNEMIWFLLGAIYERQKKYDAAEEQFRKVLSVNPRHAPALNYYGYMLAERGIRLDEAVALVQRALDEEPHNGSYLDSLGWAYFKLDRLVEAEEYLRRAAERSSQDPAVREHLGDVFYRTGRHDLAAAEWDRAVRAWRRALPADLEPERLAALEQKLAGLKQRLAQRKPAAEPKPQR